VGIAPQDPMGWRCCGSSTILIYIALQVNSYKGKENIMTIKFKCIKKSEEGFDNTVNNAIELVSFGGSAHASTIKLHNLSTEDADKFKVNSEYNVEFTPPKQ